MNEKKRPRISIGMATHSDYPGVWMTIQNIRLQYPHLMHQIEFVVIDNSPATTHGKAVMGVCQSACVGTMGCQYFPMEDAIGTSPPRNKIFEIAHGEIVLALDCHVLLFPGAIEALIDYFDENPDSMDLIQGPMFYDGLNSCSTHFENVWRAEMLGVWGSAWKCNCGEDGQIFSFADVNGQTAPHLVTMGKEPIAACGTCRRLIPIRPWAGHEQAMEAEGFRRIGMTSLKDAPAFDIPGQGLGLFACRKEAWLGFHPLARGFGGEEIYIHEKYRQAGRRALCLPALRWLHRFGRADADKPRYPLTRWGKIRNYVLEFNELKWDLAPIHEHFVKNDLMSEDKWKQLIANPEKLESEAQCSTCGGSQTIPAFNSLDAVFDKIKATPRDLNEHMDKIKELAGNVKTVTEISNRRESTLAILAGRPRKFVSYNTEVDGFVEAAKRQIDPTQTSYFPHRISDSRMIGVIEDTDMLFIDSEHTYDRLKEELDKYAPKVSRYIVMHDTQIFGLTGQGSEPGHNGMLGAVIGFVRANPRWSVTYHSTEQYGLTVLSCNPDDKPKLPGIITMASNFAKAMTAYVADGMTDVSAEQLEERLNTCSICPQRNGDACSVCGCPIEKKARQRIQTCPLAKWAFTEEGAA